MRREGAFSILHQNTVVLMHIKTKYKCVLWLHEYVLMCMLYAYVYVYVYLSLCTY